MNRRQFAKNSLMASAAISAASLPGIATFMAPATRSLKRGIMWGSIGIGVTILEKFQLAKQAGFEGIEPMSHLDRAEILKARDATGLSIPSVCCSTHGKFPLSHPDPKVREEGVAVIRVTLEYAKAYGADTILLVPGRVSDAVSYDDCWNRSVEEIKKLVSLAEQINVKIAVKIGRAHV